MAAAVFGCLAIDSRAAISVTSSLSSPLITFNTNPPASQISQRTVPGGNFDITDATTLDATVQTNEFTMIALQLESDPGNPPANDANTRWSSTGQYMQTRPTGNACTLTMATFQNDTGGNLTIPFEIDYQLTIVAPTAEQVLGHLVYYSFTGLANTWVQLPTISNQPDDNTPGIYPRSARIDFSNQPWPAGSRFYVLWADDNGSGSPETARQIDYLSLTHGDPPPAITDPTNATIQQCRGTNFSVEILGGSQPIALRWYKDGAAIDPGINPSATTTTLVISNAQPSDVGNYVCRATNPFGSDTSAPATLTVNPDTTPPVLTYALGHHDLVTITVEFSEPVNAAAEDGFSYLLCESVNPGNCLDLVFTAISADRKTVTFTSNPRTPWFFYTLYAEGIGDQCRSNVMTPTYIGLDTEFAVLAADAVTQWHYNHDGVDLGTAWRQVAYDYSSWSNGVAAFGAEENPAADPPLRTFLALTNANFPAFTHIPTYYFRTHFNFPCDPAFSRMKLRTAFDDYAYVYINGVEVYRDPFLGAVGSPELPFAAYTGGPAIGNGAWGPYAYIPLTSTVPGDNVLAVQLKQQGGGSVDIYMALELVLETPCGHPPDVCPTITDHPDSVVAAEFQPVVFSVRADGLSLQYEWQKDGMVIPGANSRTYAIPVVQPSDAGTYRVRVYNNCGFDESVLSDVATLTVIPKPSQPGVIYALGLAGETNILINFTNGPLNAGSAQNPTNYSIPGLMVQSAVLQANGRDVILTTTPRAIGQNYSLTVKDVTDAAQTPNVIFPSPTVINPLAQTLRLMDWHNVWKFDTNCQTDLIWTGPAYDDSAWASGPAPIGAEDTLATLLSITNGTGDGLMTRIPQPRTNNVHDHYFRAHFNMPALWDSTAMTWAWNNLRDDGAILYLNGAELWRRNITNDLSIPVLCSDQASGHEADTLDSPNNAPANLIPGNNLVAVHVKQNGNASSDIVWALQLDVTFSEFRVARPTLCIFREGESVRIVWPCPSFSPPADGYVLQGADNLLGPWNTIPASSPHTITPAEARQFYRLCQSPCP